MDVLAQPVEATGRSAVDIVLEKLEHDPNKLTRKRFSGTLIKRGSCAPPITF